MQRKAFLDPQPDQMQAQQVWQEHISKQKTVSLLSSTIALHEHETRRISIARRILLFMVGGGSLLLLPLVFVSPTGFSSPSQGADSATGQVVLSSSGQLNPTSSAGLNDTLTLSLSHLAPLAAGMHYVAWLIPDPKHTTTAPVLLGTLSPGEGNAQLTYVQPDHLNLLATMSGICVTLQGSNATTRDPLADTAAWRYTALIPRTPTPNDEWHYSLLDHLRHLLATDPMLEAIGLSGGLGIWLDRNTGKLFEWSNAARDSWAGGQSSDLIHRHLLRILDYLDGAMYAWRDVPVGSPFLVDQAAGHFGLLTFDPAQNPPGYLEHVAIHLQGIIDAPGHTDNQVRLVQGMQQTLSQITTSLEQMRQDALQLVKLNDTELQQPQALSLLNDLTTSASAAYAGQGETKGVTWIEQQLEQLVTLPVTTYTGAKE